MIPVMENPKQTKQTKVIFDWNTKFMMHKSFSLESALCFCVFFMYDVNGNLGSNRLKQHQHFFWGRLFKIFVK